MDTRLLKYLLQRQLTIAINEKQDIMKNSSQPYPPFISEKIKRLESKINDISAQLKFF